MLKEDCKVSIHEDQTSCNKKIVLSSFNKKVINILALLLLVVLSFTTVFTFLSLFELRQEVENLKFSLKGLQQIINDNPEDQWKFDDDHPTDPTDSLGNDSSHYDDDLEFYDEGSYDYNDDNIIAYTTGEKFTKDAKQATAPPRTKRNVIQYSESNEFTQRNETGKENQSSIYSYPQLRANQEIEQTTSRPTRSKKRRPKSVSLKSGDTFTSEENPEAGFWVVGGERQGTIRTRHRPRRLEMEERHVRLGNMRPSPAVHFHGDTSRYVLGQHDNFNGNGHLRHPQRTFVDWTESSWIQPLGMDRHFSLSDGFLTVKESGLYFIYAQIYYLDVHDMNGYRVYRNATETLLQCTTMTHSEKSVMKGNTCFTAGAEYLNEYDKISVADLAESRYSLFEPGKSFFGVIKLGDVKIK